MTDSRPQSAVPETSGGWNFADMWEAHAARFPDTTALVISGPYRFTRNPMYVGLAALAVALSLFLDTWWTIVLLMPVLLVVRVVVIAPEERYLQRHFGADYVAYTQRVRRWL